MSLLALCDKHEFRIDQLMLENEKSWRSEAETRAGLLKIWQVMQACVPAACARAANCPVACMSCAVRPCCMRVSPRRRRPRHWMPWTG